MAENGSAGDDRLQGPSGPHEPLALTRYRNSFQWPLFVINLLYLGIIALSWQMGWKADPRTGSWELWIIDVFFSIGFGIDYGVRMYLAGRGYRLRYFFHLANLLDLLVIVAPYAIFLEVYALGLVRVIRILKTIWGAIVTWKPGVTRGLSKVVTKQNIGYALNLAIVISIAAFAVVYSSESRAPRPTGAGIETSTDATDRVMDSATEGAWWLIETVTTVGYGDTDITTTTGLVAAMVLMAMGVVVFGLATAWVASIFVAKEDDREHGMILDALDELKALIEKNCEPNSRKEDAT